MIFTHFLPQKTPRDTLEHLGKFRGKTVPGSVTKRHRGPEVNHFDPGAKILSQIIARAVFYKFENGTRSLGVTPYEFDPK